MPNISAKTKKTLRSVDKNGPIRNSTDTALTITEDDAGVTGTPQNLVTLRDDGSSVTGTTPTSPYMIVTDLETGIAKITSGFSNTDSFIYKLYVDLSQGKAVLELRKNDGSDKKFGELKAALTAIAKYNPLQGIAEGTIRVDDQDVPVSVSISAFAQDVKDGVIWREYLSDTTVQPRLQSQANPISITIDNTPANLQFGILASDSDASVGEDGTYGLTGARQADGSFTGKASGLFTLSQSQ